ncbi:Ppx/GppA phosphatase family protein [Algoriphagus machipongonensis]|uniref:Probable exopolyphosphatase n=1 Tax=Algoriphagus machipongonensis TaxID=388413 RepID=A3HRX8_9BACT|nr:phosphatase [Algoriphagus machipongonensis]EAZ82596.1 probable exopolyphosphatase [Algoriphagus machipongonensis]
MKFAAIDIGSNAIRMQITNVTYFEGQHRFKRLEYIRFPMKLGLDVFQTGNISKDKAEKFLKLMRAFKLLIDLYEVEDHMVCATSAMRESTNGRMIADAIEKEIGLTIQIISGEEEATLVNESLISILDNQAYIHIDVGGGSTEINLYQQNQKTASRSFQIGSIRVLENKNLSAEWDALEQFLKQELLTTSNLCSIGTGGNISKINELAQKASPRNSKDQKLSFSEIQETLQLLESMTFEERVNKLNLNEDRADVIIPAGKIYRRVMELANSKEMLVPNLGLADGMIRKLFAKNQKKPL